MVPGNASDSRVAISVVIPACDQVSPLLKTLGRIQQCQPQPSEVLVHVDGGCADVVKAVTSQFPDVEVLTSESRLGPGGSRNVLVSAARMQWVANFDDDSFPERPDFFAQVMELISRFPDAAILSAANHDDPISSSRFTQEPMASGCGCIFRKDWFERCGGFVPLPIAYNMEEVDMGLRLHALGGVIVRDDRLRVHHDKAPPLHVPAPVNAAILANTALLPFLRFPVWLWPVGMLQVANRLRYLVGRGWTAGIAKGLRMIPGHLRQYAAWRRVQPASAIFSWLRLKRLPRPLDMSDGLG